VFSQLPLIGFSVIALGLCASPDAVIRPVAPIQQTQSSQGHEASGWRRVPAGGAICINPVQNLSQKLVDMTGVDQELAFEIAQTGYRAGKLGTLETCDAVVYTEIVSVRGRKSKSVELEFRVLLANEQVPRLCSTASGKSGNLAAVSNAFFEVKPEQVAVERQAISAALAAQARKIQAAQRAGMAPYVVVESAPF
jgi:hypothetical protein